MIHFLQEKNCVSYIYRTSTISGNKLYIWYSKIKGDGISKRILSFINEWANEPRLTLIVKTSPLSGLVNRILSLGLNFDWSDIKAHYFQLNNILCNSNVKLAMIRNRNQVMLIRENGTKSKWLSEITQVFPESPKKMGIKERVEQKSQLFKPPKLRGRNYKKMTLQILDL